MEMKSMKMTKYESTEAVSPQKIEGPRYPYGLNLRLENESIERLGIESLPKVGDEVMIIAKAKVESVSMSENSDKTKNRCVSLQITDMCIEDEEIDVKKSLYGE